MTSKSVMKRVAEQRRSSIETTIVPINVFAEVQYTHGEGWTARVQGYTARGSTRHEALSNAAEAASVRVLAVA